MTGHVRDDGWIARDTALATLHIALGLVLVRVVAEHVVQVPERIARLWTQFAF